MAPPALQLKCHLPYFLCTPPFFPKPCYHSANAINAELFTQKEKEGVDDTVMGQLNPHHGQGGYQIILYPYDLLLVKFQVESDLQ